MKWEKRIREKKKDDVRALDSLDLRHIHVKSKDDRKLFW